jgi:hypothetical protein
MPSAIRSAGAVSQKLLVPDSYCVDEAWVMLR